MKDMMERGGSLLVEVIFDAPALRRACITNVIAASELEYGVAILSLQAVRPFVHEPVVCLTDEARNIQSSAMVNSINHIQYLKTKKGKRCIRLLRDVFSPCPLKTTPRVHYLCLHKLNLLNNLH